MTFVDELKAKEREPYQPPAPEPTKEELEHQKRHEYIVSGDFAREIIDKLKRDLLDELEDSRTFGTSMARYHTVRCIYEEREYCKKEREYHKKYSCSEKPGVDIKERKRELLKYHLPHRVFDKDETDRLKRQLQKKLVADGFNVSFDIKEFKYKICSGLGLCVEKKSYGYTMSFTVHWK